MAAENFFAIKIPGIKGKYTIMHVSDVHVVATYEDEDPKAVAETVYRIPFFFGSEQESIDVWFGLINESKEIKADCMVLTGDIIDFPSRENLDVLDKGLSQLECPYIYCLGNHDWSFSYDYHTENAMKIQRPKFEKYTRVGSEYSIVDMGEFAIIAVDDSLDKVSPTVVEGMKQAFSMGKPIIVAMHVPICANKYPENTLQADTSAYWSRDICIGDSGIQPDSTTQEFIDMISDENSPVAAILAGHIHFVHKDKINSKVNQYVCCRCTQGEYTLLTVTGE